MEHLYYAMGSYLKWKSLHHSIIHSVRLQSSWEMTMLQMDQHRERFYDWLDREVHGVLLLKQLCLIPRLVWESMALWHVDTNKEGQQLVTSGSMQMEVFARICIFMEEQFNMLVMSWSGFSVVLPVGAEEQNSKTKLM